MKNKLIKIVALSIFFTFLIANAFGIEAMITRIEGKNIIINKGLDSNIKEGTLLYVTRMKKPVGTIRVKETEKYFTICSIVKRLTGRQFNRGDSVSTTPYRFTKESLSSSQSPIIEGPKNRNRLNKFKAKREYEKTVLKQYEKVIKEHTYICQFRRGAGGVIKVNGWKVMGLIYPALFNRPYFTSDYMVVGDIFLDSYMEYRASLKPYRIRNVVMEVTYWDTEYLDAFASYYCYRNQSADPRKINTIKENIYRQKGIDKFYVFQVKISNPGPGSIQIAPFPLHFFIKGKNRRISADNYDEILDKALRPNQAVNGYIYFSKKDERGQPIISGKSFEIEIINIIGNKETLKFK